MTLLERTSSDPLIQDASSGYDEPIASALSVVPGAIGVAISDSSEGYRAILVYDAPAEQVMSVEEVAMDRIIDLERRTPGLHVESVFLSVSEAETVRIPDSARTYSLPR